MKTIKTRQAEADRMIFDKAWHSSIPLDSFKVGEIFRVLNQDTGEVVEWKTTVPAIKLSAVDAKNEWNKYPFGDIKKAEKLKYFPYILSKLKKIQEVRQYISEGYIPSDVRMFVWRRDGKKCILCGIKDNLEFDYMMPLIRGGLNATDNVRLLCKTCNQKKNAEIES